MVLIVDAVGAPAGHVDRLARADPLSNRDVLVLCRPGDRRDLERALASRGCAAHVVEAREDLGAVLAGLSTDLIAFAPLDVFGALPTAGRFPSAHADGVAAFLAPWVGPVPSPSTLVHMTPRTTGVRGWIASARWLADLPVAGPPSTWTPLRLAAAAERAGRPFVWMTGPAAGDVSPAEAVRDPSVTAARVLVMIPHRNTPQWLDGCLASVVQQTRPPDAVVVVDDDSDRSPIEVVSGYPSVTLLRSNRRVGPYALLQHVVDASRFDAYAVQDADDWPAADRLARQLDAMNAFDLDLVGCQELRVPADGSGLVPVDYPVDVNGALRHRPGAYPSLHGTWLVRRRLFERTGGYATGLRFSGDSELVRRASHLGRLRNLPDFAYFRRDHPASLTRAPETGLHSMERRSLAERLQARAQANARAAALGQCPDIRPIAMGAPVPIDHVAGPVLTC